MNRVTNNEHSTKLNNNQREQISLSAAGGLPVRTNLRAGLAWDDLDNKASELWNSLTSAISNLTGGSESSS